MKTAAVIALVLASSVAVAESIVIVPTCVEIDPARDQLPESQRETARMLVVRALEQAEQLVVETGCQETIRLSHRTDGTLVTVQIENGRAQETMVVHAADLPATYKVLVAALLAPLQIEGTVGLEWNRRGSLPVSTELNLGLPLYTTTDLYPATVVASVGIAM